MKTRFRLLVGLFVLPIFLALIVSALAEPLPPYYPLDPLPAWWPDDPNGSPDGVTRAQYHSLKTDPDQNQSPDWTYNGFNPSIPDDWTTSGLGFGSEGPGPNPFYFGPNKYQNPAGDGFGANLPEVPEISISKKMGNLRPEQTKMKKEFFVLVVWAGEGTLDIGVTSELTTDQVIPLTTCPCDDAGYHATYFQGIIDPQPNWETFTFNFHPAPRYNTSEEIVGYEMLFLDSVYVGTHCVPEPGTLAMLLGLSGLALVAWRRRK